MFLHKIVLFYWYGNNCVESALAADLDVRRHRGSCLEQPHVMRANRGDGMHSQRLGPGEFLLSNWVRESRP